MALDVVAHITRVTSYVEKSFEGSQLKGIREG